MKIGFIGLGQMGKGMAINISKHHDNFVAFDRKDKGIGNSTNIKDVEDSDILFLCVSNETAVKEILFEKLSLKKGTIVVDCSTLPYYEIPNIYNKLKEQGVEYIDAAISGQEKKANDGTLTFMCGGDKEVFDKIEPILHYMGTNIIYMGKSGNGQITKTINNTIYDINIAGFCEMISIGVKLGLDPQKISDVVNTSTGRSYASEFFLSKILNREFLGTYSLKNAQKDVLTALKSADINNFDVPVLKSMAKVYNEATEKYPDEGKASIAKVYEESNKVLIKKEDK